MQKNGPERSSGGLHNHELPCALVYPIYMYYMYEKSCPFVYNTYTIRIGKDFVAMHYVYCYSFLLGFPSWHEDFSIP